MHAAVAEVCGVEDGNFPIPVEMQPSATSNVACENQPYHAIDCCVVLLHCTNFVNFSNLLQADCAFDSG